MRKFQVSCLHSILALFIISHQVNADIGNTTIAKWKDNKGYGRFHFRNKDWVAHRVSYVLHKGEIPDGLCVCHTCDNPSCVCPDHLFLGTIKQNNQDCARKGRRNNRGEAHPRSRLTESNIQEIREHTGPLNELTKRFNVSLSHIGHIRCRSSWKHI